MSSRSTSKSRPSSAIAVATDNSTHCARVSISARIAEARSRIAAAERRAGRPAGSVEILAVSKSVAPERLIEALDAGISAFGENRVQELEGKRAALAALRPSAAPRWDLIGPLQSNKVRRAVAVADRISSIDRIDLIEPLLRSARERGSVARIALQVNVDEDSAKAGFSAATLRSALPEISVPVRSGALVVDGFFTVGRLVEGAEEARSTFVKLREVAEEARAAARLEGWEIGALLSMGMSGDYEVAVEEGATQVRLGSAIFGARA